MNMNSDRLDYLFQRYLDKTCTITERKELFALIRDPAWATYLAEHHEQYPFPSAMPLQYLDDEAGAEILQAILKSENAPASSGRRIPLLSRVRLRYAAAILLLLAGLAAVKLSRHSPPARVVESKTAPSPPNDILPGSDKAILTLSDGQKIQLSNSGTAVIHDGALSVQNREGRVSYESSGVAVNHTMTTPRGSQYKLTLADGTRVWLNAASSITYPTAFGKDKRTVSVSGEVYFEVAADARKPFTVKVDEEEILVLGTSFNVNTYKDDGYGKISLMEGSIKIKNRILKPGQACQNGKIVPTNIEQDMAWKNGIFDFNRMPLQSAMNQLSRWYDVEVVYRGKLPPFEFYGKIGRDLTLRQVISGLSGLGLKMTIENGNKLIVSPM